MTVSREELLRTVTTALPKLSAEQNPGLKLILSVIPTEQLRKQRTNESCVIYFQKNNKESTI